MEINFAEVLKDAVVAGVPLLLFVIALVQWIKEAAELSGRPVTWVAMAVGLVLGGGYQLSLGVPSGFAGWFTLVVFGLLVGLGASGVYKVASQLAYNK